MQNDDYQAYQQYAEVVNQRPVAMLRDLMRVKPLGEPISIDEVEPVEAILKRFDSAGMSRAPCRRRRMKRWLSR